MTLKQIVDPVSFTRIIAEAGQTEFGYTFKLASVDDKFPPTPEAVKSYMQVKTRVLGQNEILHTLGTDYDVDLFTSTVTFFAGKERADGELVYLLLLPPITQLYTALPGKGFPIKSLEASLDKTSQIDLSLERKLNTKVGLGETYFDQGQNAELNPVEKAGHSLVINEAETGFELKEIIGGGAIELPDDVAKAQGNLQPGDMVALTRRDETGNPVFERTTLQYSPSTDNDQPRLTISGVGKSAMEFVTTSSSDNAIIGVRSPAKYHGVEVGRDHENHVTALHFDPNAEDLENGRVVFANVIEKDGVKTVNIGTSEGLPAPPGDVFAEQTEIVADNAATFQGHGPFDNKIIKNAGCAWSDSKITGATFTTLTVKAALKLKHVVVNPVSGIATIDFNEGASFEISLTENTTVVFANVPAGSFSFQTGIVERESDNFTLIWPSEVRFEQGLQAGPYAFIAFYISYVFYKINELYFPSLKMIEYEPGPGFVYGDTEDQKENQIAYFLLGSPYWISNSTVTLAAGKLSGATINELRFTSTPKEPIVTATGTAFTVTVGGQNTYYLLTSSEATITVNTLGVKKGFSTFTNLTLTAGPGAVVPVIIMPNGMKKGEGVSTDVSPEEGVTTLFRFGYINDTVYLIHSNDIKGAPPPFKKGIEQTSETFLERGHP